MNRQIYFILMRDSSEEPCVPLTKTNKLREQEGGRFRPRGRPSGGIWYLTQKNSSCSQRNNSSSRSKGTDCDSRCHGGGEGWLLLLAEKGCKSPLMSVVGGTFHFFLNEPPLHRWTPPLSDPGADETLWDHWTPSFTLTLAAKHL